MAKSISLSKIAALAKKYVSTNLLWFIFNLPIVILGYYYFDSVLSEENYQALLIATVGLGSIVFFPATSALFAVLRKFIMGEKVPIIKSYVKYYIENYMKSFLGGIFISFLCFLLAYAFLSWSDSFPLLNLPILIVAVILFVFMLNYISTIVHMEVSIFTAYRNAFVITISTPILTIVIGVVGIIITLVSMNWLPIIVPLIAGSLIANLTFSSYYKVMINLQHINKKKQESEEILEIDEVEDENKEP